MPTRLTKLVLDEISLVDQPANPGAKVVFFKRKAQMPVKPAVAALAKTLSTALAKAGVDVTEEVLANEMTAALTADEPPADGKAKADEAALKAKAEADEKAKADEAARKARESTVPPDIQKQLDELRAENERLAKALEADVAKAKEQEDKVAKLAGELAAREQADRISKRAVKLADAGVADAESLAKTLEGLPKEAAEVIEKRLLDDAAAIKTSLLFTKVGSGAAPAAIGSATAEIEKKANERAAAGKISYAEAYADIYKSDAALRARVDEETRLAKRHLKAEIG